jgi:hypothetical protein
LAWDGELPPADILPAEGGTVGIRRDHLFDGFPRVCRTVSPFWYPIRKTSTDTSTAGMPLKSVIFPLTADPGTIAIETSAGFC